MLPFIKEMPSFALSILITRANRTQDVMYLQRNIFEHPLLGSNIIIAVGWVDTKAGFLDCNAQSKKQKLVSTLVK